jgi:hypothetical protein
MLTTESVTSTCSARTRMLLVQQQRLSVVARHSTRCIARLFEKVHITAMYASSALVRRYKIKRYMKFEYRCNGVQTLT